VGVRDREEIHGKWLKRMAKIFFERLGLKKWQQMNTDKTRPRMAADEWDERR